MKRLVIITVGKTHSGKTTFARALEKQLKNTVVIDQDNHAEFLNTYYKTLLPKQGSNSIKYAVTQTIVDYAVHQTNLNIVLCNGNRSRKSRLRLLSMFHNAGFYSIIIYFNIPEAILEARVAKSYRSTNILRVASNFKQVLVRQQAEARQLEDLGAFTEDEANCFFEIKNGEETQFVIKRIINIAESL